MIDNWRDIQLALEVARTGSLSRAADNLGLHHATMLRRINTLEAHWQCKLFHRHARGYHLTAAGEQLLQTANQAAEHLDRLRGQIQGADAELSGKLVVTTTTSFSPWITPILAEFQQLHPQITLELVADARILKLEYGEAHVSIRAGRPPEEPDYIAQKLIAMPMAPFASKSYISRHGRLKSLEDIGEHKFIGATEARRQIPFVEWMYNTVPREQIVFESSDIDALKYAIAEGLGIGMLSYWNARTDSRLEAIAEPVEEWAAQLWLVTHKDMHRTAKVKAFCDFVKQVMIRDRAKIEAL